VESKERFVNEALPHLQTPVCLAQEMGKSLE
jgi:hypothetical protein